MLDLAIKSPTQMLKDWQRIVLGDGASVMFQKKYDRSLRLCNNYRALDKATIKNKYPMPLIADLFDQFGGARYFTKLDLLTRY